MQHINVLNHINHCYTNEDGGVIFEAVNVHLKKGDQVTVSFKGGDGVSSSFVNSAFIELLDEYNFNFIKTHLSFEKSLCPISDLINQRFAFEVKEKRCG